MPVQRKGRPLHPPDVGAIGVNADRHSVFKGIRHLMDPTAEDRDRFHVTRTVQ